MSHLKGEGGASGAKTRAGFEGEGQALDRVGTDQLSFESNPEALTVAPYRAKSSGKAWE